MNVIMKWENYYHLNRVLPVDGKGILSDRGRDVTLNVAPAINKAGKNH